MAKQIQLRRGTTSQHSSFTGLVGEVTVDTDKDTAVVHDGSTAGGKPLATEAFANAVAHTGDVTGSQALTIATDAVDLSMLSATGTANGTTFLRGDNSWAAPAGATGGIADGNHLEANANVADNDFLRVDGTEVEGRSATEVLSDLGSGTPGSGNFLRGDGSWQAAGSPSITDGGGSEAIDIDASENVTVTDGYFRVHKAWMGDSTLMNLSLAVCVLSAGGGGQCPQFPFC